MAGQTVGTNNYVEDFSQSQHDVIEFSGVAGVKSFADLSFDTTTSPGDTIINAGADQVTLVGFTGMLRPEDFIFSASSSPVSGQPDLALLGHYMASAFPQQGSTQSSPLLGEDSQSGALIATLAPPG
jgi:hypothetical protein